MSGVMFVHGPCVACKVQFNYDPDSVPSVPVDPETGLPPDLGGDPERARREPVCPSCARSANVKRRKAGQALFDERDSMERLKKDD